MFQLFRNLIAKLFGNRSPQIAKPVAEFAGTYGEVYANHLLYHLFVLIHEAYKVKQQGNTDKLGIQWADLKPESKDNRFPRPIPGRYRGNLTKAQDQLWRQTYARLLNHLEAKGMNPTQAAGIAAGYAWNVVKASGAKTRKDLYGKRQVEILRISGRLQQSVAPGQLRNGKYTPDNQDQIAEVLPGGKWKIGSKVPYFDRQNKQRPIIPLEQSPAFDKLVALAHEKAVISAAKEMQRRK